ncbi:hypothetical protein QBC44DRAFT_370687 [Cladorrhinum sp. PSN332]|nr:hypothetical protein QBC44DRAFT_370687 [Cladorrhinum sp. PSN332]
MDFSSLPVRARRTNQTTSRAPDGDGWPAAARNRYRARRLDAWENVEIVGLAQPKRHILNYLGLATRGSSPKDPLRIIEKGDPEDDPDWSGEWLENWKAETGLPDKPLPPPTPKSLRELFVTKTKEHVRLAKEAKARGDGKGHVIGMERARQLAVIALAAHRDAPWHGSDDDQGRYLSQIFKSPQLIDKIVDARADRLLSLLIRTTRAWSLETWQKRDRIGPAVSSEDRIVATLREVLGA